MKETVTFSRFYKGFVDVDKINSFSYDGLKALYEYLLDYEDSSGMEFEFDPNGLASELTEYASFEDFKADHTGIEWIASLDELRRNQTVIMIDDKSFLFWDF